MRAPLARERFGHPLAPLRLGRASPNPALRFWAESGAGSDPPPIVRSTAPKSEGYARTYSRGPGRSQPAPAARVIPAGRPVRAENTIRVRILVENLTDPATHCIVPVKKPAAVHLSLGGHGVAVKVQQLAAKYGAALLLPASGVSPPDGTRPRMQARAFGRANRDRVVRVSDRQGFDDSDRGVVHGSQSARLAQPETGRTW